MPATVRGKPSETGAKKDATADHKVDPKRPQSGSKDATRSTDSPKPSTARQRARDRRRERAEEASPERTSPSPDQAAAAAGRMKNLTGFWSTQKEEIPSVRKKRLEISEKKADSSSSSSESDTDDSDERDEIKRAGESAPTDRNDLVEIEKGRAKSIANIFQNRKDDDEAKKKKTPFKLDIASEEPTVFENEPVVLEGVAKGDDVRDEIVVSRPGRIKDLAVNFATICSKPRSDDSSDSEDQAATTKKEKGEVIEKGKIQNVRQRWQKRQQKSGQSGRRGSSGTKDSDADVSDSSDSSPSATASGATPPPPSKTKPEKVIEQKKVKNIRDRWTRRQDGSEEKDEDKDKDKAADAKKTPQPGGKVPIRPLDAAKEYGVFENEPVVRDDVVRADDEQPDVISSVRTKKLRRMWTNMEKEVTKDAKNPAEATVRAATKKKKEAKQEPPEPETVKKSSKSQKAVSGRYQETPAGTTADQGKGKEQQQRGGGGAEGRGKLQKAFTVAGAAALPEEAAAAKPSAPKSPSLARYSSRKKNAA